MLTLALPILAGIAIAVCLGVVGALCLRAYDIITEQMEEKKTKSQSRDDKYE